MKLIALLIALAVPAYAEEYMSPEQVSKEFKEPGHIPQGLKPMMYHPLDEVIPKAAQERLKLKKKEKLAPPKEEKKETSSLGCFFFACAHAASKKAPAPAPVVTPVAPETPSNGETPKVVDMRKYDSPIRSQWDGTCTAHGLIASMENLLNRSNRSFLSTRYFWSQYQRYSVYSAISTATRNKQVDDQYWPQNSTQPKVSNLLGLAKYQLAQNNYLDDDLDAVMSSLAHGYPVYVGMSVPSDMASCRATIRYTSSVTSGGHALSVVGYVKDASVPGGAYLILKNSWGTDCGDKGYQYFPLGLCQKDKMYCVFWSIEKALAS